MTDSRSWLIGPLPSLFLCGRPPVEASVIAVDKAELEVGVADTPFTRFGPVDADRFADQYLADEDLIALPLDLAVGADAANDTAVVVVGFAHGTGIKPQRGSIETGGILERQSFVRPLAVEDASELIEAFLLFDQGRRRRLGCRIFERSVHALMPAVLLRLGRLDPLRPDAELDPPQRQRRENSPPRPRKRGAVLRTDRSREAKLAQRPV